MDVHVQVPRVLVAPEVGQHCCCAAFVLDVTRDGLDDLQKCIDVVSVRWRGARQGCDVSLGYDDEMHFPDRSGVMEGEHPIVLMHDVELGRVGNRDVTVEVVTVVLRANLHCRLRVANCPLSVGDPDVLMAPLAHPMVRSEWLAGSGVGSVSVVGLGTGCGRVGIGVRACLEAGAAGVVASVGVAVWAGPLEHSAAGLADSPAAVGLEAVMSPTQGGEVGRDRGPGLGSPAGCGVVVEGDGVVEVAAPGGVAAPGEHAGGAESR